MPQVQSRLSTTATRWTFCLSMTYTLEVITMLEKNRQKKERAARRQTFVGVRPARFKKKTAYDRKAQKNDTRAQINGD